MHKAKLYAKALKAALEGKSSNEEKKIIRRFKELLKKRGDLRIAYHVEQEFKLLQEDGTPAEVITAEPLSQDAKTDMKKTLEKKGFSMKETVDPNLIGGTAVFLGTEYMIDGTVRGKLNRIAKLLRL